VILFCSLSKRLRSDPNLNAQFFRYNQLCAGVMDLDDSVGLQVWEKSEILVGLKK